jgi:predicted anti-sigma-YlaC factor YlaD
MNCHSTRAVLDLYLEQRLAPGRAAALEKHLSACASCRALSVPAPVTVAAAAPAGLKARLLAAAKAQPSAEPRPKIGGTLSLLPRDLLSVAAAALALGLIALGLGWNGAPNQSYAPEELAGRMP